MKLKEMNIKEKTKMVVETIVEENGTFNYFEDMLRTFDSVDSKIIKEKMDNLMLLMEDSKKNDTMSEFMEMDFEEEIWFMI